MAYFVKQTPQNGRVYLQIINGVYDPKTQNAKQKVFKKLGYLDELQKQYVDPLQYYKDWCIAENELNKQRDLDPIPEKNAHLNLGYFPFRQLYKELNIKRIVNNFQMLSGNQARYELSDIFESLVYARILNPSSKLDTYEGFLDSLYHSFDYSKSQMYDAIELLGKDQGSIFEGIQLMISDKYRRNMSRVYFDATNFYFEIDKPNDLAKPGPSKEMRNNPIIGLGLLLDGDSIPLDYHIYPGNASEKPIYREVLRDMKEKNGVKGKVIRIADKGLNCSENIADAYLNKDGYIFSQTIRGAKSALKKRILDQRDYVETKNKDGEVTFKVKSWIDYEDEITVTNVDGKKVKVNIPQKQIAFWSRDYAEKSAIERERALQKLSRQLSTESSFKYEQYGHSGKYVDRLYLDDQGNPVEIDEYRGLNQDKILEDQLLDGYYLIVTSEINAKDSEIIEAYKTLWEIEESFRLIKSTLKTRPVYHSTIDAIKGHFLICLTALLFIRMVEKKKLKGQISASALVKSLKKYTCAQIGNNRYQLFYYDDNLGVLSQYYSIKLNQHYKTSNEIKDIFNE
jgi:transposase